MAEFFFEIFTLIFKKFQTKFCRYLTLFLYLPGIFPNGLVSKLKFAELGGFSYQPKVPLPYFLQKQYFLRVLKKIFFIGRSSREKEEEREAKKSI